MAHSLDRAMFASYHGNLFQLVASNGTTTLDVGQNSVTRAADMTTWSSICNVVSTTAAVITTDCKVKFEYDQSGNGNTYVPSIYASANCNVSALTCAAIFRIDVPTGLPIIYGGDTTNADWSAQYTMAAQATAVGVNGGTTPISVWLSGRVPPSDAVPCCGWYGVSHSTSQGNIAGTDFLIWTGYTNKYPPDTAPCASSHCVGADVEAFISPTDAYAATDGDNANWIVTWDGAVAGGGTNTFCNYYNGTQLGCHLATTANQNSGIYPREFGGGDLTQPAKGVFRSGFVSNNVITSSQAAALKANEAAFYGIAFN
jgi:hypothetical protein